MSSDDNSMHLPFFFNQPFQQRDAIKHSSMQCLHSWTPQAEKASQSLPLVHARYILVFSALSWRVACSPTLIRHSVRTTAEKCTQATELCFVFGMWETDGCWNRFCISFIIQTCYEGRVLISDATCGRVNRNSDYISCHLPNASSILKCLTYIGFMEHEDYSKKLIASWHAACEE